MQESLWAAVSGLIVLAIVSGLADRRRQKRRDFDAVGWVPWRTIQFAALFATLLVASIAMHVN